LLGKRRLEHLLYEKLPSSSSDSEEEEEEDYDEDEDSYNCEEESKMDIYSSASEVKKRFKKDQKS
jgi:hypothetical protein